MPKIIRIQLLAAFALLLILACSSSAASDTHQTELVVFAASSLTDAFRDAAAAFEAENPGVRIILNFDGSQRLRTQLEHGARADLFASADWQQMDILVGAGLVNGEPVNFTANRLVVVVFPGFKQDPTLADLTEPGSKVLIAQETVPAGFYSRTMLANLQADPAFAPDYADQVLANVVSEEANVRNVAQKVALGEADAGIVYQTDAVAPGISQDVLVLPIPESLNITAVYPIANLRDSTRQDLARGFIEHLMSDEGQQVLRDHGFGKNPPTAAWPAAGRLFRVENG